MHYAHADARPGPAAAPRKRTPKRRALPRFKRTRERKKKRAPKSATSATGCADRALATVFLASALSFCACLLGWPDPGKKARLLPRRLNLVGAPLARASRSRKAQFQRAPVVDATCATSAGRDEPERTRRRAAHGRRIAGKKRTAVPGCLNGAICSPARSPFSSRRPAAML